ncbi:hypothetical protein PoB_002866500 [Plakobranchus ocellatus]|uniref:Uncharacterized protein n=1 Tax=Plakobranchus ocellatus TaxID=259542 RepID=A0AAV4A5Q2_9GAST|nr:hypothetical protein PoB_002866500 [Plakobranchus ocellatus]
MLRKRHEDPQDSKDQQQRSARLDKVGGWHCYGLHNIPNLFVLAMKVILRAAERNVSPADLRDDEIGFDEAFKRMQKAVQQSQQGKLGKLM